MYISKLPAINYEEDTEFNAALRQHGIIPPKEPIPQSPSPPPANPPSPTLSEISDLSEISVTKDDLLPRAVLEEYRTKRLKEQAVREDNRKFGRVYPISKIDYTREVTEASEADLEGSGMDGEGTGVVCVLYKDYLPLCKLLLPLVNELSSLYPSTKFVSIISDHCIENYPDKNCPTMLVYRKGKLMGQIVGMGAMGGEAATLADVERILFAFRGLDLHLKTTNLNNEAQFSSKSASTDFASLSTGNPQDGSTSLSSGFKSQNANRKGKNEDDEDEEDSEDDQTFTGGGRRSGIRSGGLSRSTGNSKKYGRDEDDDEYDM